MGPNIEAKVAWNQERKDQELVFGMTGSIMGGHLGKWEDDGLKHASTAPARRSLAPTNVTPWLLVKWLLLILTMSAVAIAMWYSITLTGIYCAFPYPTFSAELANPGSIV
jgi:hypothetical protein